MGNNIVTNFQEFNKRKMEVMFKPILVYEQIVSPYPSTSA